VPSCGSKPPRALTLALLLAACTSAGGSGQDRLTADWPEWQRIESGEPPSAWQVEEASFAFDAWETEAVVAELSTTGAATTIRSDDGEGDVLAVRLAALPSERFAPRLAEGDSVRFSLIRRLGFEGIAQGLTVRDAAGQLLLLYDDGGYGLAYYDEGPRDDIGVSRSLRGAGAGDEWESAEVTFQFEGESVVSAEGESVRLGRSGFVVSVVVSREWTGEPVTDLDLSPLAYLVFRTRE